MSANDLLSIQRGRERLIPKLHGQLGGALLVMPTTPITAPEVAPLDADDELFHKVNLLRCATPCSATYSTFAPWRCPTAATPTACRRASSFRPPRRGRQAARLRAGDRAHRDMQQRYAWRPNRREQAEEQAMARIIQAASAQMGPIAKSETRKDTVRRLIALMREAKGRGAELVVFPELALTTFFPRWLIEDEAELDSYYETRDAGAGDAAAVRRGEEARHRLLSRLRRARRRRRPQAPLQHLDPRRPRRQHRRQVPQGASAGPCRAAARPRAPASGEALFRAGQSRLPGVARASAASWACASATTAAGPRPTA